MTTSVTLLTFLQSDYYSGTAQLGITIQQVLTIHSE
jgi:hypothetical protein